jgi:hypothetical protein
MQHLTVEALARIVDDPATPAEEAHLAACSDCRDELRELREQTARLAALPPLRAPAHGWERLARVIARDGAASHRRPTTTGAGALLRAAAVVGIFLLGGGAGLLVGRASLPDAAVVDHATTDLAAGPSSPEEAARRLRSAEAAYVAALARYAELTGGSVDADPLARLVALEGILLSAGAALEEAPADPLINGYYLTAASQREAVLRQIAYLAEDEWF